MNTSLIAVGDMFDWVLQTSWQAAVLVGLILLVQQIFKKRLSPGWRYGLWMLLVVRLIMPASPASSFSLFNLVRFDKIKPVHERDERHDVAPVSIPLKQVELTGFDEGLRQESFKVVSDAFNSPVQPLAENPRVAIKRQFTWREIAVFTWFIGVLIFGGRLIWNNVRFSSRIRRYIRVQDSPTLALLEQCQNIIGVKQSIEVIETEEVETPAVYGFWRKRLLLPDGIFERFSKEELRHIFLHELAHIKRRDLEVQWLAAFLQVLHWFNPLLWLGFSRMRSDRELATDELVLSCYKAEESAAYGETILKVLADFSHSHGLPELVGIAESKNRIKERLQSIARYGGVRPWRWGAIAIAAGITCSALTGAREQESKTIGTEGTAEAAKGNTNWVQVPLIDSRLRVAAHRDTAQPEAYKLFQLRFVDYDTLKPLGGVKVHFDVEEFDGPSESGTFVTKEDGIASLELVTGNLKRVAYRTEKEEYLSLDGQWIKHEIALIPDLLEVKLSKGVAIGGIVTSPDGQPLSGAEIYIDRPLNFILDYEAWVRRVGWKVRSGQKVAVTDANGNWSARCIHPNSASLWLRARHPGYADVIYSTEITKAMEANGKARAVDLKSLVEGNAKFSLKKGWLVNGQVLDETGLPGRNISVRYTDQEPKFLQDPFMGSGSISTDAQGRFQLDRLTDQRIFFSIHAPGYAPVSLSHDPANLQSEVSIVLSRGDTLFGTLKGKNDEPIPGATITFQDWDKWVGIQWKAATDVNGNFEWDHAPKEPFVVFIEKEGFIPFRKRIQGGGKQVVSMLPALRLEGRILDSENDEIIKQYHISWASSSDRFDVYRPVIAGTNGSYVLDLSKLKSEEWAHGYPETFAFRVEADGYAPFVSREFSASEGDIGVLSFDAELKRVGWIEGRVFDLNGRPVQGAQIAFQTPTFTGKLLGKPKFENVDDSILAKSDGNGKFRLTKRSDGKRILFVHESGFAVEEVKEPSSEIKVILLPWGTVTGTVREYGKAVAGQGIWLSSDALTADDMHRFSEIKTTSDDQGRFRFNFVPPVKSSLFRMIPVANGRRSGQRELADVKPGKETIVDIGGKGMRLVGRITIKNQYVPIEWSNGNYSIRTVLPKPPAGLTIDEFKAWRAQVNIQKAYQESRHYPIHFNDDGSFYIDEVLPGNYQFDIKVHDPRDPDAFSHSRYVGKFDGVFEVPQNGYTGRSTPFNLGTFEMSLKPLLEAGKADAPDFSASLINGSDFKLSDFRGKYVLLDFWATWCAPCVAGIPHLRQVQERFKGRSDFVMVSLGLNDKTEELKAFLKKNEMPWLQAHFNQQTRDAVTKNYGVDHIPSIFLINPEGKIIAKDLEAETLSSKLEPFLK